ncbi:MAG: PLP-dependent aminotransferase family protein [Fibromonadales bacterium]|nr:PLP-dependent aminotransferase family protein [Fibromonadales bacterium]
MEYALSNRMKDVSGSAIRELFELLKDPEIISFAGGWPTTETLPAKQVESIVKDVVCKYGTTQVLQYESSRGKPLLLERLKHFLKESKGLTMADENLVVISGGQQGIEYMCKLFVNEGDTVLVQDPTYLSTLQIVATYQGKSVGVKADANGLDLVDLEEKIKKHKPKMLYVVPTFSNPTGGTYSVENRKGIAEITAKHGVLVLEDDPYSQICYDGEHVPPIKTFDKTGNVFYMASFSKIIAPSLRVAVIAGAAEIMGRFIIAKQSSDVCNSSISQLIVAEFLQGDVLKKHIETIIPVYKEKRDKMLDCIKKYVPSDFVYDVPKGGMFIWGYFKSNRDVMADFKEILKSKVAMLPGTHFYADGGGKNTMRLNFSNASLEQIETGIKILGDYFTHRPAQQG